MERHGILRTRRSRRGDAVMAHISLKRHLFRASSHGGLSRRLHCAMTTAAALVACAVALVVCTVSGRYGDLLPYLGDTLVSVPSGLLGKYAIRSRWPEHVHTGRSLRVEIAHEVTSPLVPYETQLELFMCNPSLGMEDNDAHVVEIPELTHALSRIHQLEQADTDEIMVTTKIAPEGADDEAYKCEANGMLQWRVQINYPSEATAADTSPAISAASANDYIAFSPEFKSTLASYINEEYTDDDIGLNVTASNIEVVTLGWFVIFPDDIPSGEEKGIHLFDWVSPGIRGDFWLWKWWVWMFYGLLVACCLLPFFCCLCIRRPEEAQACSTPNVKADKVYGPEWGVPEPDYAPHFKCYSSPPEFTVEYSNPVKSIQPVSQQSSRSFNTSVSRKTHEAGKRSVWALPSPSGGSPLQDLSVHRVQRVEDDDDADTNVSHMRNARPDYHFDMAVPGSRSQERVGCHSESKTGP